MLGDKWEYYSAILSSYEDKEKAKQAGVKEFHPVFLNSILNQWGEKGWELIHIQPVHLTGDHMIQLDNVRGAQCTNQYHCIFKRRKLE